MPLALAGILTQLLLIICYALNFKNYDIGENKKGGDKG